MFKFLVYSFGETGVFVDVLAEVLESVRLDGSLYSRAELQAPWGMGFKPSKAMVFHVVHEGQCWLRPGSEAEPILLGVGDLAVVRQGLGHQIASGISEAARVELSVDTRNPSCQRLRYGSGGPSTTLLCGSFRFAQNPGHPLLPLFPPVILVRGKQGQTAPWLEMALRFMAVESETERPGQQTILRRLSDILFVQVVRAWLESSSDESIGWIRGLRDPQIGTALGLMHRHPERRWTVAALAHEVGLARTSFATRFRSLVGEPPLAYLGRWRVSLAAELLREDGLSQAKVAERVGYESEAAFSHAFKRYHGTAPGAYRRAARTAAKWPR
ncbi:AraC family transcriptional regulator [Meiothermus granaticius]|uniref:RCS-specific HTH-type transcriptional activator RclR n=1 Tax=Meiothermus granaticius NBRC 107808 TaxID=1227551 RepID=A0A399FCQ1_9DEIN|nr:AraC family transcriptional regulator [Meiothermus granaticius]MCL6527556.1 AraC family transcriptional regulator [Thermaceae bacterium]RIH93546.1 RCS-specific HTH-type transcriptional activator RclR [Meiothermus granaticius NBRC 107808]GEM86042.1 AraC family transcriptional regulator [Meiothermus granaticius NBRC 107808]